MAKVVSAGPEINNPDSTKPVELGDIVGTPEALEVDQEDADQHRMVGVLSYLGFLCFLPLVMAKDSPYAKYHANQGFVLFLLEIAIWFPERGLRPSLSRSSDTHHPRHRQRRRWQMRAAARHRRNQDQDRALGKSTGRHLELAVG
jgi:hypothetical protein